MVSVPTSHPVLARQAACHMLDRDPSARNRLFGAARLTGLQPAEALDTLRRAALREPDARVRRWVMVSLGTILTAARGSARNPVEN
jgi:hypothetical protein